MEPPPAPRLSVQRCARLALFGFLVTFLVARTCVFLIMAHLVPNMYLFMQGTHVHHLNYGIFLLSLVGGYSVFRRPEGRAAEAIALAYGIALGLTFDEFGMWLHLGGSYWQRASVDAVIVVAAGIALCAYATTIRRLEARHFWAFLVLAAALAGFGWAVRSAGNRLGRVYGPRLEQMEEASSP